MLSTTTTADRAGAKTEPESDEENAGAVFDRIFAEGGLLRANIIAAFESSIEDLPRSGREDRLRDVAKAAALATARHHGNIIETGRVLLSCIDELGQRLGLDVRRCKDQVMLGLAEGACQVGPIVYSRYLDIASEYRDNADTWIANNKRRAPVFEALPLPVIVPFEAELTLTAQPFKEVSSPEPASIGTPSAVAPVVSETESTPADSEAQGAAAEEAPQWSRPRGKGFFARLSNVMGSLFGRS